MRNTLGLFVLALAIGCGNMAGPGNNGGNGGTGGGGTGGVGGGSGGGGSGGSGGGGTGGSGGGSGGTPDYASGSRIKARTISSADGAKAFAGFYDSQLSVACSFVRAADDALRCLPTTVGYMGSYFADSGCATPLAYSAGCTPTHAYLMETATTCIDVGYNSSNTRYHVYAIGALFTGQAWAGKPGTCTMTTPGYPLYSVGSEVPASNFAAGSVDIAP